MGQGHGYHLCASKEPRPLWRVCSFVWGAQAGRAPPALHAELCVGRLQILTLVELQQPPDVTTASPSAQ